MTEETWEEFSSYITSRLQELKMNHDTTIPDQQSLDKCWYKWNMAVKEAANKFIPTAKVAPRTFHGFNFKATKLHQALKIANKIKRLLLTFSPPKTITSVIEEINTHLQHIAELAEYPYLPLTEHNLESSTFHQSLARINEIHKALYRARNLKNYWPTTICLRQNHKQVHCNHKAESGAGKISPELLYFSSPFIRSKTNTPDTIPPIYFPLHESHQSPELSNFTPENQAATAAERGLYKYFYPSPSTSISN
ncbi:37152_t:CDS:2 [Gigaspora margarita]|uniref:37152_t:CDS:1 n=1 Tax=Gigaspora margarita TaxID=4874 RepID=A0ABN7USB4_GIGMA|nr:37152_t:CDS:2 [Gigaspora margarita]